MPQLYREKHWDNDRALRSLLKKEFADIVSDVRFHIFHINRVHAFCRLLDRILDDDAGLVEKLLRFAEIDEASGYDVRGLLQFACLAIDDGKDDEDSVLRQHLSVADDDILNISD